MDKRKAVKLSIGAGVLAIVAFVAIGGRDSSRRNGGGAGSSETEEKRSESKATTGGSLLSSGQTAGQSTSSPAKPAGTRDEAVLKRLAKVALNPKLESALRAGSDPLAGDLLLYLRTRKAKSGFTPTELNSLSGALMDSFKEKPEAVLSLIGRGLNGLEGGSEVRQDRLDLLGLVGAFPAAENPEISRSAVSTLTDLYANGGGIGAEDGFDSTVTSIQAYLATTRASADVANSTLVQAMGGKIEPAIQEVYKNLFSDRYPAKR